MARLADAPGSTRRWGPASATTRAGRIAPGTPSRWRATALSLIRPGPAAATVAAMGTATVATDLRGSS
ncbi:MAG: hypothetical protein M3N47_10120, partial [Chloroflexota bacterium]|nr:hypothetical protein [Chloroflexota bacterium]